MADIEDIKKANDERKLNILKGFAEVGEIQKGGNFNFAKKDDETSDDEANDNDGLGDSNPGEVDTENVDEAEDQMQNDEANDNLSQDQGDQGDGFKTVSDFAKETSSEDLQTYLDENPTGEHAEEAKQELQQRGDGGGEGSETPTLNYADPEAVKQALEVHPDKEAIVQMMLDDPTLTASMALRLHDSAGGDKVGLSEKIDAAQQALDNLKSHVGHEDEDDWFDDDYDSGLDDQDDNEEDEQYNDEFDDDENDEDFESDDEEESDDDQDDFENDDDSNEDDNNEDEEDESDDEKKLKKQ